MNRITYLFTIIVFALLFNLILTANENLPTSQTEIFKTGFVGSTSPAGFAR